MKQFLLVNDASDVTLFKKTHRGTGNLVSINCQPPISPTQRPSNTIQGLSEGTGKNCPEVTKYVVYK